jgi:site-specific recombinase XerD
MQVRVVQGKGKKDRYTILSKKTLELLRFYYKIERPSVYLFEPQGQKGITLSDTTLNNIVQKNAKKAGIKKDISFHTLRHCFATHLLEQGVNLKIIQQFLGHNSLKTTSVYLSVANINLSSVVSPLDSMDV